MDPKLLFQLCEVIDQGSMSRAAANLNVTQPTLTRNIKLIEELIGEPVLNRDRYGVSATNIGEHLARHGRHILHSMAEADDTVRYWKTGIVGELRFGIEATLSTALVPELLLATAHGLDHLSVRIVSGTTNLLHQDLRRGDLDVAIMPSTDTAHINSNTSIKQVALYADELCLIAGSDSPLAKIQRNIDVNLLADQQWVSINRPAGTVHADETVAHNLGIQDVRPKFEFDGDVATAIDFVRYSKYLTLVNRTLAEKVVREGGLDILEVSALNVQREIILWISDDLPPGVTSERVERTMVRHFSSGLFQQKRNLNWAQYTEKVKELQRLSSLATES